MRYVQRDADGKLIAHFAHPHDYADEAVDDDHPDIVGWNSAREEARRQPSRLERRLAELEEELARLRAR